MPAEPPSGSGPPSRTLATARAVTIFRRLVRVRGEVVGFAWVVTRATVRGLPWTSGPPDDLLHAAVLLEAASTGVYEVHFEVEDADRGEHVMSTAKQPIYLERRQPTLVHRDLRLLLPEPGTYLIQFWCEGERLGETPSRLLFS